MNRLILTTFVSALLAGASTIAIAGDLGQSNEASIESTSTSSGNTSQATSEEGAASSDQEGGAQSSVEATQSNSSDVFGEEQSNDIDVTSEPTATGNRSTASGGSSAESDQDANTESRVDVRQSNTNTYNNRTMTYSIGVQDIIVCTIGQCPEEDANQSNSATIRSTPSSSNNTSTAEAEGDAVSAQEVEASSSVRLQQSNDRVRGNDND